MIQDLHYRLYGARLGIVRAIDQARDPRVHHGSGAHGAGYDGDEEFAIRETMIADDGAGLAQGHDLGMGRGIAGSDVAVPAAADDFSVAYDDRADGHFAGFERALRCA